MKWFWIFCLLLVLSLQGCVLFAQNHGPADQPYVCNTWINTLDSPQQLRIDYCGLIDGHAYQILAGANAESQTPAYDFVWPINEGFGILEIGLPMDAARYFVTLVDMGEPSPWLPFWLRPPLKPP